jgi:hypothetical protein
VVAESVDTLAKDDALAADLLAVLSYAGSDAIPISVLTTDIDAMPQSLRNLLTSSIAVRKALTKLRRYGLAQIDQGDIRLHPLYQAVVRDSLDPKIRGAREAEATALASLVS